MSQTAYGLLQTPQPGVLADNSPVIDKISAVNTDDNSTPWNIPFGVAVARTNTTDTSFTVGCEMPTASGDEILGVTILEHTHDPGPFGTVVRSSTAVVVGTAPGPGVIPGATLSLLRRGRIWVLAENDAGIVPGVACFVRYNQNGAGKLQLGAFRSDNDGGSNAVQVNARFLSAKQTIPATTPYPGQSAGASQPTVLAALIECDFGFAGTIP